MPTYKILLPPFVTDAVVEGDTVELSEKDAAPSVAIGVLKPLDKPESKAVKDAKSNKTPNE
jgi:hypothetical protein